MTIDHVNMLVLLDKCRVHVQRSKDRAERQPRPDVDDVREARVLLASIDAVMAELRQTPFVVGEGAPVGFDPHAPEDAARPRPGAGLTAMSASPMLARIVEERRDPEGTPRIPTPRILPDPHNDAIVRGEVRDPTLETPPAAGVPPMLADAPHADDDGAETSAPTMPFKMALRVFQAEEHVDDNGDKYFRASDNANTPWVEEWHITARPDADRGHLITYRLTGETHDRVVWGRP